LARVARPVSQTRSPAIVKNRTSTSATISSCAGTTTPDSGNTPVSNAPGVVTFRFVEAGQATHRIYAFVGGGDNHLHVCYWNGVDQWLWNDLGTP
jgi:hypothetical protein